MDTGSGNIDAYDPATKSFGTVNKVYFNSTETCLFLAKGMTAAGVKPHLSVWVVPFVSMVDALLDMGRPVATTDEACGLLGIARS